MDNQNLEQLIYEGQTQKSYKVLGREITFVTFQNQKLEEQRISDVKLETIKKSLAKSILYVDGIKQDPSFLENLTADELICIYGKLVEFCNWLNEDPKEVLIKAIFELAKKDESRFKWVTLKTLGFDEWKKNWNNLRELWVYANVKLDEEERIKSLYNVAELICAFVNPEGYSNWKRSTSKEIVATAKTNTEERQPDVVDDFVAQMVKKNKDVKRPEQEDLEIIKVKK